MKRRNEPIDPQTLNVHKLVDKWVARSRWWSHDEKRIYLRLHTSRGVVEIYRSGRQWFVSRIAD